MFKAAGQLNERLRATHWLTRLVSVVMLLAMAVIVFPGEPYNRAYSAGKFAPLLTASPPPMGGSAGMDLGNMPPGPHSVIEYRHGWPMCFLRRAKGYGGDGWPPPKNLWMRNWRVIDPIYLPYWWNDIQSWSWRSDRYELRLHALLIDLLVAAMIVIVATFGAQRWTSLRHGVLRWRLVDLLVVTTCIGGALAWWQWHLGKQQFEEKWMPQFQSEFSTGGGHIGTGIRSNTWTNFTPAWLRRLLGTQWLTSWCGHWTHLTLPANISKEQALAAAGFPYLESVSASGLPSDNSLRNWSLLELPKSIRVSCDYTKPKYSANDFSGLAKLPGLKSVDIHCRNLLIEDLLPLVQSGSLQRVKLSNATVTSDEAEEFRRQYSPDFQITIEKSARTAFGVPAKVAPRDSARIRLARWSEKESIDWHWWGRGRTLVLDLKGVQLSKDRLRLLSPICQEIQSLQFGTGANVEGVIEFILACTNLKRLSLGDFELTNAGLEALSEISSLKELSFRQGESTPAALVRLAETLRMEYLEILVSTLTRDDLAAIEGVAGESCSVSAYRDSESEDEIYSSKWYSPEDAERDKLQGIENPFGF